MKDPGKIIKLFVDNELILRDLYAAYAKKFPASFDFWNVLVHDEENHAKTVDVLYKKVMDEVVVFDKNRFNTSSLQTFYDSVKKELEKVDNKEVDFITALSVAVNFEEALIERDYFVIFESDVAEIKKTLTYLREGSIFHLQYVRDKWNSERQALGIS